MNSTIITVLIILVFLLINFVAIAMFRQKQDTVEEYSVGSRSFPWILNLFGFLGSWYVGSTYTGFFGDSATIGLFALYLTVYSVGIMATMYILAEPVWTLGKLYKLETIADMAELRYNSKKFGLFIAISTFIFWAPWLIVELRTVGYVVSAVTHEAFSFNAGLIIVGGFVILYSWWGGMRAGVIGDLVQGFVFVFIGTGTVIYLYFTAYDGIGPMFHKIAEEAPSLLQVNNSELWVWSSAIITAAIGGMMNPGIFNRLYMADGVKSLKKAALASPIIASIFVTLLLWLGLGAGLFEGFPDDPQDGAFWFASEFGGALTLGLMGVFALAACMSTISGISVTASVLIGKHFLSSKLSDERRLKVTRLITLLIGAVAIIIATAEITSIVSIVIYIYEFLVQVSVPLILGLFWKRGNVYGAFSGMIAGTFIIVLFILFPSLSSFIDGFPFALIAIVVNLVLYLLISLLTPRHSHVNDMFNAVKNYKHQKA